MIQHFEEQGVMLTREQCRRIKFQVKSITHSITKILKVESVSPIIEKELNLVLDFCGRIMNDIQQTCTLTTIDERRISNCDSITSKAVEYYGVKGLQNYKQISQDLSYNTMQLNRTENNKTELSMKIEGQIRPYDQQERCKTVKTSQSHNRIRSDLKSTAEEDEYRIRPINRDLRMNSKEVDPDENEPNYQWKEASL